MYIEGIPREQLNLFEEKLDDIISEDNVVRFIDAYVNKIDLEGLGFTKIKNTGMQGRPPYRASTLLKIYIYGYLNRVRSSRKLENECKRNIELMWLTGRLAPDFKTIADFRKDNRKGLKRIYKEFLKLCHKLELISLKYIGIDGTKSRAQNGHDSIYRREDIDKIEERLQERIDKYLEELELNDREEENEYEYLLKNLPEKIAKLKKSKEKVEIVKKLFESNPELEILFKTDPESRLQRDNGRIDAGYNCQTAVDEKNGLIVATDVTNESNDLHQLNSMINKVKKLKDNLEYEEKTIAAADSGYFDEMEIVEAEKNESFDVYVSYPRDDKKEKKEKEGKIPAKGFRKDNFKYDREKDIFHCPEGKKLERTGKGYIDKQNGVRKYQYICKECNGCSKRKLCTNNKKGRVVKITEFMNEISDFREKCDSEFGKQILKKRKEVVEHPFGTIKRNWGYRYFMQKGLKKVQAEFSFIAFIYNLKRVLNIVPFENLMEEV